MFLNQERGIGIQDGADQVDQLITLFLSFLPIYPLEVIERRNLKEFYHEGKNSAKERNVFKMYKIKGLISRNKELKSKMTLAKLICRLPSFRVSYPLTR